MSTLFGPVGPPPPPVTVRGATFSPCRAYRYTLTRTWGGTLPLVVIGLNPSTADESLDDPTIRRCMAFARSWGHGGLVMLNLFAFRSTDPKGLEAPGLEPVGEDNDRTIVEETKGRRVLCAWGVHGALFGRAQGVSALLRAHGRELVALGLTKEGHPRHPLYVRGDTLPVPFGSV